MSARDSTQAATHHGPSFPDTTLICFLRCIISLTSPSDHPRGSLVPIEAKPVPFHARLEICALRTFADDHEASAPLGEDDRCGRDERVYPIDGMEVARTDDNGCCAALVAAGGLWMEHRFVDAEECFENA